MLCHGNGNNGEGCCFINGQVCPLRWRLENGHIYNASGTDLGPVQDYVYSLIPSTAGRTRAMDQLQGVKFVCTAAINVLVLDARLLNNRAGFEAAWMAEPSYVAQVAPLWRAREIESGLPTGTLDCANWKGTAGSQCCFIEDSTTNAAYAATLSTSARNLRQAGGT